MNVAMNLAAAAGGAAARVATDRLANWMSGMSLTPATPGPSRVVIPNPPSNAIARGGARRGRGRGRRRGRRPNRQAGQPAQGAAAKGGSIVRMRDTEIVALSATTFVLEFNPAVDAMPRLAAHEKMYTRYRYRYVNIAFKSTSGTATDGSIVIGIASGPALYSTTGDNKLDRDKILKMKPMIVVPAWKNDTIAVGAQIDASRWMFCGDTTRDGVAFTVYVDTTATKIGVLQISYDIEFDFPRPF